MRVLNNDVSVLARAVVDAIVAGGKRIICLMGDLGAGKTTLTQEVCGMLGVKDDVVSPTFSIINVYRAQTERESGEGDCTVRADSTVGGDSPVRGDSADEGSKTDEGCKTDRARAAGEVQGRNFDEIYHIDLYRIDDLSELDEIGFDDILYSDALIIVEWADRYAQLFPDEALWIKLGIEEDGTRYAVLPDEVYFESGHFEQRDMIEDNPGDWK